MQRLARILAIVAILFTTISSFAMTSSVCGEYLYNKYKWSAMYYYGITASDGLMRLTRLQFHSTPEQIQTVELAYTLDQENLLRKLLHPIVPVVQVAGNVTYRFGSKQPKIYEFDPYLIFRWTNFCWNCYINTSLAFAEGVSYDTSIPLDERENNPEAKRFLNYMMFESTFALPDYPRLQLLVRLHHRSGVFGLYGAGKKDGTNAVGLGIRYLFD